MSTMEELAVRYLPDDFNSTSQRLSQVLDSIGINRECVLRQRIERLQVEKVNSLARPILEKTDVSVYIFGSQSEVSTTPGLNSDTDIVIVYTLVNITDNRDDIIQRKLNALMDTSSSIPGYCRLISLLPDALTAEFPHVSKLNGCYHFENLFLYGNNPKSGTVVHGPALNTPAKTGVSEFDTVGAFHCKAWPKSYRQWSSDNMDGHWPTAEMRDVINKSGCFVVPTAHCLSEQPKYEWRISTSAAERHLMFNLNITQLRCYILLKMILKTFIKTQFTVDTITSYHCKTVLFHCIENSSPKLWVERNLLKCVTVCLYYLLDRLKENSLSNYFNNRANIFLGKFDDQIQTTLVHIVQHLLESKGEYLKAISCDGLNEIGVSSDYLLFKSQLRLNVVYGDTLFDYGIAVSNGVLQCILALKDFSNIADVYARLHTEAAVYSKRGVMEYISSCSFLSKICSHFACIAASRQLERGEELSTTTEDLFKRNMESDVVTSKLKYASVLLCSGRHKQADIVLQQVEDKLYSSNYCDVCSCYPDVSRTLSVMETLSLKTVIEKEKKNSFITTVNALFCVMFTDAEKQCCPKELQYEMLRTITEEDKANRDNDYHIWMGSAVVDPYALLFFLKYKVATHLGDKRKKDLSLRKLDACTNEHQRFAHKATTYNLLGQCFELENEPKKAYRCYYMSLRDRQTNNYARWHIALQVFRLLRYRWLERDNTVDDLNTNRDGQTINSQDKMTDQQNVTIIYQRKPQRVYKRAVRRLKPDSLKQNAMSISLENIGNDTLSDMEID